MTRVLLFTNTIAPYRLPVFEQLAQVVDLHVLFAQGRTADRRWDTALEKYDFQHAILPYRRLRWAGAAQFIHPDLLRRYLSGDFEVIILSDNRQTALSELLISTLAHIQQRPLIIWTGITPGESTVATSNHWLQRFFDRYRRWLFRRATAIIAYGSATQRHLIDWGITKDKIVSGTQIVPEDQLPSPAADKAELGLRGKTVTLSVNYLLRRKGLDILTQAFKQVAEDDDVLALVGSGPEGERLRELAGDDERIQFPGYQFGAQKTAWYAAADLFAFPTLHDPWGLVVNEAMAFGLPIIATDAAGCVDDLVQSNGFVVPAGNVQALAHSLECMFEDRGMRERMGRRSQDIIADYTVEKACSTFINAITYALELS